MYFPEIKLTDAGRMLIVRALSGETLTFTKFKLGNGAPADEVDNLTDVTSGVIDVPFSEFEKGKASVALVGTFDNGNLESGFYASELGVFAKIGDDDEVLYAYAYEKSDPVYIPAHSSSSYEKTTLNIVIAIGDAENVTAIIGGATGFVSKEEFKEHLNDNTNPHGVTAAQIGLGKVPNLAPQDCAVAFEPSVKPANLLSGERISILFGKCAAVIKEFFSHLSGSNPHGITASQIGAAESGHSHYLSGKFSGNGTSQRYVNCGFTPQAVIVMDKSGRTNIGSSGIYGGLALPLSSVKVDPSTPSTNPEDPVYSNSSTAIAITNNGFYVNEFESTGIHTNKKGIDYVYIAFK